MQTLLIVDDEPNIVEGLVARFEDAYRDSLIILKAFSGRQALGILRKHKVDVVLSDIRMPDIDGLELSKRTAGLWPGIRFVFLSGYDDFQYIHEASKSPIYRGYLLKMEGDDQVAAKVGKELLESQEEARRELEKGRMERKLCKMRSYLNRAYLESALRPGEGRMPEELEDCWEEIEFSVNIKRPFYMVFGKFESKRINKSSARGFMLLNQMVEKNCALFRQEFLMPEQGTMVWILQEKEEECMEEYSDYLYAVFSSVQEELNDVYGFPVSFVVGEKGGFENIAGQYGVLNNMYEMASCSMRELLMIDQKNYGGFQLKGAAWDLSVRNRFLKLLQQIGRMLSGGAVVSVGSVLEEFLEGRSLGREEYLDLLVQLLETLKEQEVLEIYYEDTRNLMNRFLDYNQESKGPTILEQYVGLCDKVCRARREMESNSARHIIRKINQYIDDNIENYELSLTELARITGFNPSYLSRFYRQNTGEKLSTCIEKKKLEHARNLLEKGVMIKEVASRIGFASPSAFILFFKRNMGVTPKQFREQLENKEQGK